jgi:hypothetical protein
MEFHPTASYELLMKLGDKEHAGRGSQFFRLGGKHGRAI